MTHEINIYGDIVPFHSGWGDEYSLKDLNSDLAGITFSEGDELMVNIHTYGGCTATSFGIKNKLRRFAKENKISLSTRVDGWCASSGVIILLASNDKRVGNSYAEPFIHNAWTLTMGDKNDHQKKMEDLKRVDDQIANLYSEVTNISKEDAIALMNSDGFITAEKSLEFGFFTELEDIEVVEIEIMNSIKKNNSKNRQNQINNMSDKNKQTAWNALVKQAKELFGTKNKIVFTADNSELDFYELGEEDSPTVGSKAKFDGKPAGDSNDGEYTMPSGEVYKFTGEELMEIVPKEDDSTDDLAAENQTLKDEVANLQIENKKLTDEKGVINKSLNDAKTIINSFKNFDAQFEDEDEDDDKDKRDPKEKSDPKETNVSSAIKNLKKKNTNGGN